MMWPRLVFVKEHTTVSPAPSVTLAVRLLRSTFTLELSLTVEEQLMPVRSQPATIPSVTVKLPGWRLENRIVSDSVASAPLSSSRLKLDRPTPVVVNAKSCGSAGFDTFVIRIEPRWVFVNVQVTVSPAARAMALTGLLSEQMALVRSQPAGTVSATE